MNKDPANPGPAPHAVIIFDGECNFCSRSVRFIVKHDPAGHFRFASRQSPRGQEWLQRSGIGPEPDSMVLIENGHAYLRTAAIWRIARQLNWPWRMGVALAIIPAPLRDAAYSAFAKRRRRWFGANTACAVPTPELSERFLP